MVTYFNDGCNLLQPVLRTEVMVLPDTKTIILLISLYLACMYISFRSRDDVHRTKERTIITSKNINVIVISQ